MNKIADKEPLNRAISEDGTINLGCPCCCGGENGAVGGAVDGGGKKNGGKTKSAAAEALEKRIFYIRLIIGALFFALGLLLEHGLIKTAEAPFFEDFFVLAACLISYFLIGSSVLLRSLKNIFRSIFSGGLFKTAVFDENFLMSISTVGAFAIGEYPEAAAVMLFYQIGETLQEAAAGKSSRSIEALLDLRPPFANLIGEGGLIKKAPADILVGERILVRPGERVPLDGIILEGASSLDLSALTGESMPKDLGERDEVLAGAVNQTGVLKIEVTKPENESTMSKILRLVSEASEKKSQVENFITKFARYWTPAVVLCALLLAVLPPLITQSGDFSAWLYRALVFLVVSCPCALVISIPLTFFGGLGAASRRGILIKGSAYLSALAETDSVIFDKTGTLTKGIFKVSAILPEEGISQDALLKTAFLVESCSNHPAAAAVCAYTKKLYAGESLKDSLKDSIKEYKEIAGMGVKALLDGKTALAGNAKLLKSEGVYFDENAAGSVEGGGTAVYIALDGAFLGTIIINDELKDDAQRAVADLRALGVNNIAIFSGDTEKEAVHAARGVGIETVYSALLPHEKAEKLESLMHKKKGRGKTVFVGDGINDAPSIAMSDIGCAMGAIGQDAAIEAADVVLMGDEPSKIAEAVLIGRRTRRIGRQNIAIALAAKGIILLLGALGAAKIWTAVFGDVGVALIAVFNAMRNTKLKPPRP